MTELEDLPPAAVARVIAEERKRHTEAARQTFRGPFFEAQVDPGRELPTEERARLAEQARRAHYANLGRRSGEARRARRAAAGGAP